MDAPDLHRLFGSDVDVQPYGALYLHMPFCRQRCRYCDFTTAARERNDASIDAYVEDLALAVRHAGKRGDLASVETVYLGGGTPSFVGMERLSSLLYMLSVSMNLVPEIEFSMEANPDSLDVPMVRDLWALGVNRLSIGVQSFDDGILRLLGRVHDASAAARAIDTAQVRFQNVSVDLMCGIPGQTEESLAESVQRAIDLGVTHVSVYPLMVEAGTPFARMVESGELPEPSDDLAADHMLAAAELLQDAGYSRYEVASYAKPGFACRHNIAYWTGVPYLGLGTGACSMAQAFCEGTDGRLLRRLRIRDGAVEDDLDSRQIIAEDLMLGMRMSAGVPGALLDRSRIAGLAIDEAVDALSKSGLVVFRDGRMMPTERGWLCGNELYGRLLELAP